MFYDLKVSLACIAHEAQSSPVPQVRWKQSSKLVLVVNNTAPWVAIAHQGSCHHRALAFAVKIGVRAAASPLSAGLPCFECWPTLLVLEQRSRAAWCAYGVPNHLSSDQVSVS